MFEAEQNLLKKLCQKSNTARQSALENELRNNGIRYENWNNYALVVPSSAEKVIVLCSHFDSVCGSFGYNDNGMALVTVLQMLHKLPADVEIVFTNCEEQGAIGADYYLKHTTKQLKGCINLDVVGCFDQVYVDIMNCSAARSLNCKHGTMPFSDAYVFARQGVPSVCFSSGPSNTSFNSGIMAICNTIHNNRCDNDFGLLNFKMIEKVTAEVQNTLHLMKAA